VGPSSTLSVCTTDTPCKAGVHLKKKMQTQKIHMVKGSSNIAFSKEVIKSVLAALVLYFTLRAVAVYITYLTKHKIFRFIFLQSNWIRKHKKQNFDSKQNEEDGFLQDFKKGKKNTYSTNCSKVLKNKRDKNTSCINPLISVISKVTFD